MSSNNGSEVLSLATIELVLFIAVLIRSIANWPLIYNINATGISCNIKHISLYLNLSAAVTTFFLAIAVGRYHHTYLILVDILTILIILSLKKKYDDYCPINPNKRDP